MTTVLKRGTLVLIDKTSAATKAYHGFDDEMKKMRHNVHKIDAVISSDTIVIKGYYWHPNDLKVVDENPSDIKDNMKN